MSLWQVTCLLVVDLTQRTCINVHKLLYYVGLAVEPRLVSTVHVS